MTSLSDEDKERLRRPRTWEDYEFKARRELLMMSSPFGRDREQEYLRRAAANLRAAEILKALDALHD